MPVLKIQFFVLLAGTLFAWYNFLSEYISWREGKKCKRGCPVNVKNPFLSPCFGGAVFFTIAFILNVLI
jgi:hypothetical protein